MRSLFHACITANAQCEGLRDGFYADTEQCDKYVRCANQTVKEVSLCPDGLVFNEYGSVHTARCELPFNIDCSTRPQLRKYQSSGRSSCFCLIVFFDTPLFDLIACSLVVCPSSHLPQSPPITSKGDTIEGSTHIPSSLSLSLTLPSFTCSFRSCSPVVLG
jgi:hypothetical protein